MEILDLINRKHSLLDNDIIKLEKKISNKIKNSSFLVLGGAGSIGQSVSKEIFKRKPIKLHVVDISENNLVELVRDLRSKYNFDEVEFKTFALDIGSWEYDRFFDDYGKYDYVLNLSALKHVRSEKDPYTLMRMIDVNIFNTIKTIKQCKSKGVKKYFCVSTDKAANPVNMMGASKRIMEMFLMRESSEIDISTARFANVAFSDGSLLYGFTQRILKNQPISTPNDVKRYFVSSEESGQICLLSCLFGRNRDIFFPKLSKKDHLLDISEIAINFIISMGYEPKLCSTEQDARKLIKTLPEKGMWPCLLTKSDTTGEKSFEEFFTKNEKLDLDKFEGLGIIKNGFHKSNYSLDTFIEEINKIKQNPKLYKENIVDTFMNIIPDFIHDEKGKNLDSKM